MPGYFIGGSSNGKTVDSDSAYPGSNPGPPSTTFKKDEYKMRKRKTIKVDSKEITVKELTVKEIMDIFNDVTALESNSMAGFVGEAKKILPLATDIALDDLYTMAPSDIKEIYDAIKEVNAVFFDLAESLGIVKMLEGVKSSIVSDFSGLVLGSLTQDT